MGRGSRSSTRTTARAPCCWWWSRPRRTRWCSTPGISVSARHSFTRARFSGRCGERTRRSSSTRRTARPSTTSRRRRMCCASCATASRRRLSIRGRSSSSAHTPLGRSVYFGKRRGPSTPRCTSAATSAPCSIASILRPRTPRGLRPTTLRAISTSFPWARSPSKRSRRSSATTETASPTSSASPPRAGASAALAGPPPPPRTESGSGPASRRGASSSTDSPTANTRAFRRCASSCGGWSPRGSSPASSAAKTRACF
mmetsp:Transcript_13961/g.45879  ORF Transcript_13961/g.45879 Transcript_13961/m.45879 type:complete len:257 (+) Transcript_13961:124-894(+)